MRIEYLAEATEDMEDIKRHYVEAGGKSLALRMVRRIREETARLSDNPYIAPPYEFAPGLRRLVVVGGTFLVYYGVTDRIEILHVHRAEREPVTEDGLLGG